MDVRVSFHMKEERKHLLCTALAYGVLILLTFSAFNTILDNDFITYDDPGYVTENSHVLQGLTWASFQWAWKSFFTGNWHPLTWLSHMLDVELYGTRAAGHHGTSLLLHLLTVLLLFGLLSSTTRNRTAAFFTAAFFAVHPLRTESVAWVAERKDVLCGFFGLLSLWAYALYARKPKGTIYMLTAVFMLLGLLSKAMIVTWPFVFLLLDFWPLKRLNPFPLHDRESRVHFLRHLKERLIEKVPFAGIALPFTLIAFLSQRAGSVMPDLEAIPLSARFSGAAVSYLRYLGKIVWPHPLVLHYPYREVSVVLLLLALLGLTVITAAALRTARTKPWLLTGWLWFLGTLVPVIGLVQIGSQSIADRYTYLPSIGIMFAVMYTVFDPAYCSAIRRNLLTAAASLILLVLLSLTWIQTSRWRDSETLYLHTIRWTGDNPKMELNLVSLYRESQEYEEGLSIALAVLERHPNSSTVCQMIGSIYLAMQNYEKALDYLNMALKRNSSVPHEVYSLMAAALAQQGQYEAAENAFQTALRLKPEDALILTSLGQLYRNMGRNEEAKAAWQQVLQVNLDSLEALGFLADLHISDPNAPEWAPQKAIDYARLACRIENPPSVERLFILARAYAANGEFDRAEEIGRRAVLLAWENGLIDRAKEIESHLSLYRQGRPYRQ